MIWVMGFSAGVLLNGLVFSRFWVIEASCRSRTPVPTGALVEDDAGIGCLLSELEQPTHHSIQLFLKTITFSFCCCLVV